MQEQVNHYQSKINYEIDSADVAEYFISGKLEEQLIVIDARSAEDYAAEHIPGAINFPHRLMNERSTVTLDKNALYVVYCDGIGCNASTKGAFNLAKLGFKTKELMGGIDWWKRDGYSTEGTHATQGNKNVRCSC